MENEKSPVKYVNKSFYEELFSTRFIVFRDQLKQDSTSPVWDGLKIPAELIVKNLEGINNKYIGASKVTLQITVTAILEVTQKQND